MTTKTAIKAAYIRRLQVAYPFYVAGSRPLHLANEAADSALSGKQKIKGECWSGALAECGLSDRITLRDLAALPD